MSQIWEIVLSNFFDILGPNKMVSQKKTVQLTGIVKITLKYGDMAQKEVL